MIRSTFAVGALALVCALACAPAGARAASHTQRLDVGAELVRQQPGGKPWIVNLVLGAQLGMDDGTVPSPVRHMVFSFTRGARVHPEAFATCGFATITKRGPAACPAASRVGSGKAVAAALQTTFDATVTVYNGPKVAGGRQLVVYARALGTVSIPMPGTLKKTAGRYGWVLDLPVPRIMTVGEENDAAITSFEVKVGGIGRKKVPFIEAPTSCAEPGWPFLGAFSYADGASGSSSATIPCLLKGTND
ncbi:MAG TPA: hypothetical protein VFG42_13290 [Baekduia sp.]|uniref:hypothetical protein n=1 Tax=Baekduia sp. TaxID=2600305 RepID=UPI002D784575|nr:hypothetical protein [Baekduia sp.]HET6507759.1 hypothetical protein [Baekduia sp.]